MSQIFSALHLLKFSANEPPAIASDQFHAPVRLTSDTRNVLALKNWISRAVIVMQQEREERLAAEERARRAEEELERYLICGRVS